MKGMEKISEAILNKVRVEAESIIKEAKEKAQEEIEKAEKQRQIKLKEKKSKVIEEAKGEAARMLAQASIRASQEILRAKTSVINEIIEGGKNALSKISDDESSLLNLTKEAVGGLGANEVRIYVSPKDMRAAQAMIRADKELSSKIAEVKEYDCKGGVIAEDIEAKVRIDNTYETRLEILLPRLIPEIAKELF